MIEKTKTVYYCQHCKKHGLSKHAMERHEKYCMSDPNNIPACFNCKHLGRDYHDISDTCRGPQYFYCMAQDNKPVHNIVAVRKRLPEKHPESFEGSELMPSECDLFEQKTEIL